jgi:DNA-directed RNA polymerase specialized sigma24 family protein
MEFTEYVAARHTSLVRAAVLLGAPPADAANLVQTALVRAHHTWRRIRRAEQPDADVYAILLDAWRDARAHRWHGGVPDAEIPEPPDTRVDTDETRGLAVRRALAAMTPERREVLVLRYYSDLSEREAAGVLRLKRATLRSRAAEGLDALSAGLAAEERRDAHGE